MAEAFIQANHLKKYFKTPRGMLHADDDVTLSFPRERHWASLANPAAANRHLGV